MVNLIGWFGWLVAGIFAALWWKSYKAHTEDIIIWGSSIGFPENTSTTASDVRFTWHGTAPFSN